MIVTRRDLLRLAGSAGALASVPARAAPAGIFALFGGALDAADRFIAGSIDGGALMETGEAAVPLRLHGFASHPRRAQIVALARRPGDTAFLIDRTACRVEARFAAMPGLRFSGHGHYLGDGSRFLTVEIALSNGAGFLVVRDPEAGYEPIARYATGGDGPHEIVGCAGLVAVANGAREPKTDPGIAALDSVTSLSSIALIDPATGAIEDRIETGVGLDSLSLRHLATAPRGRVVVTAQDNQPGVVDRPLVALYQRGRLDWMDTPPDALAMLRGYVGSAAVERGGRFAAVSSPRGGIVLVYDLASRNLIGEVMLPDVCGLAADAEPGRFIATSGHGDIARLAAGEDGVGMIDRRPSSFRWDNHLTPA